MLRLAEVPLKCSFMEQINMALTDVTPEGHVDATVKMQQKITSVSNGKSIKAIFCIDSQASSAFS